jgi:hypothetical protein
LSVYDKEHLYLNFLSINPLFLLCSYIFLESPSDSLIWGTPLKISRRLLVPYWHQILGLSLRYWVDICGNMTSFINTREDFWNIFVKKFREDLLIHGQNILMDYRILLMEWYALITRSFQILLDLLVLYLEISPKHVNHKCPVFFTESFLIATSIIPPLCSKIGFRTL